jgi:biotin synthase-like enzyme/GTPase SAR1 family protein
VEKLVKEMKGKRTMPWETALTEEEAAASLAAFFGTNSSEIRPGDVLDLDVKQIEALLKATTLNQGNKALDDALFTHAESVTHRFFGKDVYFRGIVEFSNVCEFDCYYCGVRKHQPRTWRYTMPIHEVVEVAEWAFNHKMGTLMLQSGQLTTPERNNYIMDMVRKVRERTIEMDLAQRHLAGIQGSFGNTALLPSTNASPIDLTQSDLGLCVALSSGELPLEQYQAFREVGADRYLLRIETSNPDLYATLHPAHQRWDARVQALQDAKKAGFMIGTGVMVGLPGQTLRDLASDVLFFRDLQADMIGMGPYITESGTPAADLWAQQYGHLNKTEHMKQMVTLTTRMNALARITLGNVNIAATTALQAIDPVGRELALRRGANVLMPILTPTKYREHYTLYEGKPCINDTAEECQKCLNARLSMVGKKLKSGIWGDPPSFRDRLHPVSLNTKVSGGSGSNRGFSTGSSSRGMHTSVVGWTPAVLSSCGVVAPEEISCPVPSKSAFTAAAKANGAAIFAFENSAGGAGKGKGIAVLSPSPSAGSDIPRTNLGIFGRMNAGKSSLMNRITCSEISIVDSTPGTTADTKIALMELHAAGPVKLFDTAGIDEDGVLGEKKRKKVLSTIKECDIALVVVNLNQVQQALALLTTGSGGGGNETSPSSSSLLAKALKWEKMLVDKATASGAEPILVFNRNSEEREEESSTATMTAGLNLYINLEQQVRQLLDPENILATHTTTLSDPAATLPLSNFLENETKKAGALHTVPCLPADYLNEDAVVFLNIPMDAETPTMRLLRPQALVQEEAIRNFATTIAYRMNLNAARSADPAVVDKERQRFCKALKPVLEHQGPALIITDSQAVDIVHPWTMDSASGEQLIPFTTFSIAMVQRQSRGALPVFAAGIEAFKNLKPGDHVLVAEACNHNRITELCNDIGMVQIPQKLQAAVAGGGGGYGENNNKVIVEHAFGREFPEIENLDKFALAVHCGGCMVDSQKIKARISDLTEAGVPVINYGVLLAYAHSPEAMKRALEPWGVDSVH